MLLYCNTYRGNSYKSETRWILKKSRIMVLFLDYKNSKIFHLMLLVKVIKNLFPEIVSRRFLLCYFLSCDKQAKKAERQFKYFCKLKTYLIFKVTDPHFSFLVSQPSLCRIFWHITLHCIVLLSYHLQHN